MKGLCFKEPLFNLAVKGRKTQTRRVVKPQPDDGFEFDCFIQNGKQAQFSKENPHAPKNALLRGFWQYAQPRYKVGETLYLQEPYFVSQTGVVFYKFDNNGVQPSEQAHKKWENKLFMPEKFARYFIEITNVRCERLQDISDEDCAREGIWYNGYVYGSGVYDAYDNTPKRAFANLINSIEKGAWERNPYVFVYNFKIVKK